MNNKDKEKLSNIPGSIYLPRKRFPTKQKYEQETAERVRERESRGQFKAHKRTTDCFRGEMLQCSFSLRKYLFTGRTLMFTLRG